MRRMLDTARPVFSRTSPGALFIFLLAMLAAFAPGNTSAHATFDRSDPQPNSVLAESPPEIRIWFTEPLEEDENSVRLFDQAGNEIPNITVEPGDGAKSMLVRLPDRLDTGTYSVVWKNLSSADGHPMQGYFTFTIGTAADVAPMAVPILDDAGGAPLWLQAIARWLVLLALAVAVAVWPVWLLVLWPSLRGDESLARELGARAQTLGMRAIAMVADEPVLTLEAVPLITATSADYKKYLPWGPFYGVFVKKETPDAVKKVLVDAFKKGVGDPKAQEFIRNFGSIYMGISGDEANQFLKKWQSTTSWLLHEAGATKSSPEKFGIPKP